MRRSIAWSFALAWLLAIGAAIGAEPQFTRISPDLRVYPQYFSVEQGRFRHIYVGGIGGILRFDGSRWTWLKTPKPGAVRALHADASGRLWVGGSDCFGYLRTLPDGRLQYVDLAPLFRGDLADAGYAEANFADIWQITEFDGRIYFRGLRDVFAVDASGARAGYWHHEGRFGEIDRVGDELWLQWRGEGLRRLRDGDFVPVAGTGPLSAALIYNLFVLKDGGVLITDDSGKMKLFRNGRVEILDDVVPAEAPIQINRGVPLGHGKYAFGSFDGALRIFDLNTRRFESIAVGGGLLPEVLIDDDDALLSVNDQGLIRLDWPYRWLRYGKEAGVQGSINAAQRIGETLYLSTGAGAYRAPFDGGALDRPLVREDWTTGEAWFALEDDAGLLLAESRTLNRIENGRATVIGKDDLYPRTLLLDPAHAGYLWVGSEFGAVLLRREGKGYAVVGRHTRTPWLVSSLAATPEGILLGSDENGLALATFDPRHPDGFRVTRFGQPQGLRYGANMTAKVSATPDGAIVSTEAGLFRYRAGAFVADTLDGLSELLRPGEIVAVVAAENGDRWAYSYHTAYRRGVSGRWAVVLHALPADGAFRNLLTLPDGDALIAANGMLIRYLGRAAAQMPAGSRAAGDPGPRAEAASSRATLRIAGVRLDRVGQPPSLLPLDQAPRFLMTGAWLEFDLALTDFSVVGDKRYEFRLEGFDDAWTDVGAQPNVRFFSLPPGRYTLHVRARIDNAPPVLAPPYAFEIIPHWYQRAWFVPALVALASLILVYGLIRRQRRRLAALRSRNLELDALVRERTRDLEQLNFSLQDLADRDGLTGIANRRKFDAFLLQAAERAQDAGSRLGLALIDVDHFKAYNDSNGHQAGDDALIRVVRCLSESVRGDTLVARYGGEEFAIVAPGCGLDEIRHLGERIRAHVEEAAVGMTVSVGVSELQPGETLSEFVARADAALYRAKSAGRNRVV
jgi:diguanylate cyclase (GGDEF)-like protein